MAKNDLFSVLEHSATNQDTLTMDSPNEKNVPMAVDENDRSTLVSQKWKAFAVVYPSLAVHSFAPEEAGDQQDSAKNPRLTPSLLLDDFETKEKQEVAASAGLDNAVEAGGGLELKHQVRHQVTIPPSYNYIPISQHIPPAKPHHEYKFELDLFQKVSVYVIQWNESVLVSMHTSAGKMVVAEYAITQCLVTLNAAFWQALSNQKYHEMLVEFGNVSLMTGDVTINSSATCLVMTIKILCSMLYHGSEIIWEVVWVIFDEIHYMRDKERGIPPFPMLCNFCLTPLQHYLFPVGSKGIYMVVNEKGEFREDNFMKAMGLLQHNLGEDPADPKSGTEKKSKSKKVSKISTESSDISRLIQMIMQKNCNPVIVFSFNKQECKWNALEMIKFQFTSAKEQDLTTTIFHNTLENLSIEDRQLPQITEVIKILFQEGLIKVLFATETFSIGLNMPAKTVMFTRTTKRDGKERQSLPSGEYIQMSGHMGRQGLDERDIVIMMCDENIEPVIAREMITGQAD
ncbi:P-loop containing nucleoside triphosphate hydrolase protein [Desarmillaria tabescens]|uniref:P-loop containing nucleoside triphosphate hydrolase protein n=1 Tax=Armillaria tabescens TaxID=1929756 RepID=A0AA39MZT4_ARMTA|nr:P-loop containing nucleoside triphosphate hydrolase protein [Desarmillaria tabescens]KAK0452732.1 P-loop containing nucleoside triphosphate hydrolase protein [Desarmillaria tabescens]